MEECRNFFVKVGHMAKGFFFFFFCLFVFVLFCFFVKKTNPLEQHNTVYFLYMSIPLPPPCGLFEKTVLPQEVDK